MATSQNGWAVHTSSSSLEPLAWVTGRVRGGDVHTVFDHLCRRFDAEVENITVGWSWGWAFRAIRGQTSGYSNHASGTAIDLNAPIHPLGKHGTFTSAKAAAIHRILADLNGVVRWGGDYSGRPDEMHFEINADAARVAAVAARIRGGSPSPDQEDEMNDAQEKMLREVLGISRRSANREMKMNGALRDVLAGLSDLKESTADDATRKQANDLWRRLGQVLDELAADAAADEESGEGDASPRP